jgi:redox-sensitive bicupin YhaK (pirin superfamily)
MIRLRRSGERGRADLGWLDSRHTFSFADYHDPAFMGFRQLRVINEDRVAPSGGFPLHSHRDMEILSVVLEGELEHRDSLGNRSVIRPGEVQRMSAGRGVQHSEANPSSTSPVHFLQIWILPEARGLEPGYAQKAFPAAERRNRLRLVASRDGRDGAVDLRQDAELWTGSLDPGAKASLALRPGRHAWVQVAGGRLRVNGEALAAGDGASISDERSVDLVGVEPGDVFVFDLA